MSYPILSSGSSEVTSVEVAAVAVAEAQHRATLAWVRERLRSIDPHKLAELVYGEGTCTTFEEHFEEHQQEDPDDQGTTMYALFRDGGLRVRDALLATLDQDEPGKPDEPRWHEPSASGLEASSALMIADKKRIHDAILAEMMDIGLKGGGSILRYGWLMESIRSALESREMGPGLVRRDSLYQVTVTFQKPPGHYWEVVGKIKPQQVSMQNCVDTADVALYEAVLNSLDAWQVEHSEPK